MTLLYASPQLAVDGAARTREDDIWAWGCTAMRVRPTPLHHLVSPSANIMRYRS